MKEQLEQFRKEVLEKIQPLLPTEQRYVDWCIPFCAGIKYLGPGSEIGFYQAYPHQLELCLEQMPLDSLVSLLEKLEAL